MSHTHIIRRLILRWHMNKMSGFKETTTLSHGIGLGGQLISGRISGVVRYGSVVGDVIRSDIAFIISVSTSILRRRIQILADVKKYIRMRQNQISDTNEILANHIRILIGHTKMDTVMDKINGYTYITFHLI